MRIDPAKLDLALAKNCMSIVDLRTCCAAATLVKIRHSLHYEVNTKTAGKIAKALNVDVTELLKEES